MRMSTRLTESYGYHRGFRRRCLSLYTLAIQSDPELLDQEKLGFKQTNLRFGALVSGKFNLSEYVDDTPIIDGNEPDLLRILAKPLFGRFIDAAECSKIYSLRNLTGKLPPLFLTTSSDDFIQYESLALADALARNHVDLSYMISGQQKAKHWDTYSQSACRGWRKANTCSTD